MFGLSKDIQFFLSKVLKIRMIKIFSLNYRLIVIICFVVVHQSNQVPLKVSGQRLPNSNLAVSKTSRAPKRT